MANEPATLLDAPADPKAGTDTNTDTSLLDTKPEPGKEGSPPASPDATKPADANATPTPNANTKPVVPEKYELKAPENTDVIPEFKQKYDELAKTLGLSQESYQKLADLQFEFSQQQMSKTMDAFNKQIQDWTDETKKELGADPAKALSVASKAIDKIFSDPKENAEFREMMKTSGLGNWRLMVKAFTYVGKAISDDKFVEGRPGTPQRKSTEDILFDHPTSIAAMKEAATK